MKMIYQFENDEIKKCIRCPMWVFPEMATMPLCNLTGETIPKGSTPQDNDCPLLAIPKTGTTSCEWCEGNVSKYFDVNWYDFNGHERLDKSNYCPACGRRLKENEHDISV